MSNTSYGSEEKEIVNKLKTYVRRLSILTLVACIYMANKGGSGSQKKVKQW